MWVITYRKIFYLISVVLIGFSVYAVATFGLNFGIDFKGGSVLEVSYATTTAQEKISETVKSTIDGESLVRSIGEDGYIIKTKNLTEPERVKLIAALEAVVPTSTPAQTTGKTRRQLQLEAQQQVTATSSVMSVKRFDSVGPVLGKELQRKAWISIVLVILGIIIFITFVFRKVSRPVSSFKYGMVAIVALLHDVIVPTGVFAYLGRNGGYELDSLFITALLVILGFSVHDTIVVFDRTRENLKSKDADKKPFERIVGDSISQTFTRSINTSLTTVLALVALYIFGPETTRNFALALIIGIVVGTYSSIFIGSPLLVTLYRWSIRNK
jgi:preprotein translocase subunit SecF